MALICVCNLWGSFVFVIYWVSWYLEIAFRLLNSKNCHHLCHTTLCKICHWSNWRVLPRRILSCKVIQLNFHALHIFYFFNYCHKFWQACWCDIFFQQKEQKEQKNKKCHLLALLEIDFCKAFGISITTDPYGQNTYRAMDENCKTMQQGIVRISRSPCLKQNVSKMIPLLCLESLVRYPSWY